PLHGCRATIGKGLVVRSPALAVCMPLNLDADMSVLFEHLHDRFENWKAFRPDLVLFELEVNLLHDLDVFVGYDHERFLRASRSIAAGTTWFVRTHVFDVRYPVLVVVGLRTSIFVLEAIGIFRVVRTFVLVVRDAVEIVVWLGTP